MDTTLLLNEHFFTIKERKETGKDGWICRVALNVSHPVFRAHFPGNPVMPAVCTVQMVKDVAAACYSNRFFIRELKNVKFLHVLNPVREKEVFVHFSRTIDERGTTLVAATIRKGAAIFSTLQLSLEEVEKEPSLQERMDRLRLCVLIPTYNNGKTLERVLREVLKLTRSVIVINDGSTDDTDDILTRFAEQINHVSYATNMGKGFAIKFGFLRAGILKYRSVITIDSDGQHDPNEIEEFVRRAESQPDCLWIGRRTTKGKMPLGNRLANLFSSFWFFVQTGRWLWDTQNGFRLYPLEVMNYMLPSLSRYDGETELLVRTAWRGIPIRPTPVHVYYAPKGERVTHFRTWEDFFRICVANAAFVVAAFLIIYPRKLYRKLKRIKS